MIVQIYSRKPLVGRRQWRWRAIFDNGRIAAVSSESYNNIADCRDALGTVSRELRSAFYEELG